MNHRQDADATKTHGQDARATFQTPSVTGVQSTATLDRRGFLQMAAAATGVGALAAARGGQATVTPGGLIDVNTYLGHWPLRHLPGEDTADLVSRLRRHGVVQAWVGSLDGLLHKDIAAVNVRLADECRRHGDGVLVPFGSVNPTLPDWQDDLRRCVEEHRMPGIRLHPNYHGYKLDDPDFAKLLRLATERGLIVQLALIMEDERTMHPLLRVAPTSVTGLAGLVKQTAGLRLVLLNSQAILRGKALADLLGAGEVCIEIATLEGVGGVANLLAQVPPNRVLFGSYAPVFYFESALLKLQESPLSEEQLGAIRGANARRLLAKNH
ncbi:MAG: amidohydrolase family protein [Planctomycetes bacterium]|nr:amidohydrolase family protein [Planctomycetota bacterium]